MARVTVNKTALTNLSKAMEGANNKSLQVGWLESAKYDDGTPVAGIAAQNEYGNPKLSIPPRPFIRPTIENESESWAGVADQGAKAFLSGKASITQVLNAIGLKSSADIKNSIVNGSFVELSPITIALRKIRNDDKYKIGGALVGSVASAIADGQTGAGQLGDQSFGNKDPLRETGYMIATLSHEVF